MPSSDNFRYGIVVDAGSSGSRVNIFKWEDSESLLQGNDDPTHEHVLQSVPKIYQEDGWSKKVSPGLSTYENKPHEAFPKHIKSLLEFAEKIIPTEKIKDTPLFIQATAGMRMLPPKKKEEILKRLCKGIKRSTGFLLKDCSAQIQVIDGETEGLYGWLSLNYLFGHFSDYDSSKASHFTFGFMDMGGGSMQIAFAPSISGEVEKHKDDITTVYLKNINGDVQKWDVFVGTWLGFGANQARKRYLAQLINNLPENSNDRHDDDFKTRQLSDPCMPKGCRTSFEYKKRNFKVLGTGNYEQCVKSIYPLLLKHLPCIDEPCLFNGVHAPQMDFYNDKFVGTSEYWYTANDVFKLGGAYDFDKFSTQVKKFCNSDWDDIQDNYQKGLYDQIRPEFLADSCFKANWVLNVLHEGFGLPRMGVDEIDDMGQRPQHPLFQSAKDINERELSWTLGRILLYASGSIMAGPKDVTVGVIPSSNSAATLGKKFLTGAINSQEYNSQSLASVFKFLMLLAVAAVLWFFCTRRGSISELKNWTHSSYIKIKYSKLRSDSQARLEEGTFHGSDQFGNNDTNYPLDDREGFKFRSKSMFNLHDSIEHLHSLTEESNSHGSFAASSPQISKGLRPAFSLADFPKARDKDGKLND